MSTNFDKLKPYLDKSMAITTALTLISWDDETLAPSKANENTSKAVGILSDEYFKSLINDNVKSLLNKLSRDKSLTPLEKSICEQLKKEYKKLESIPPEEYREYSELISKSNRIWAKARKENKFEVFAPCLKKIIDYKKKFASYRAKNKKNIYNELLNDYEEGFNTKVLDEFFEKLKKEVVPLVKKVVAKNDEIDKSYNSLKYDVKKQAEFSKWLAEYLGFDFDKGVIAESEHPFTTSLHNHDVRITTHYHDDNLENAIFSTIHETGHALYEMGMDDSITQTLVGTATCGMHESQSRFFENVIGRSKEFWEPIYPKLQKLFSKQLKDISLNQFIKGVNKVEPGAIRIESDELTYCLHIIVRYEIEKLLFNDKIEVEDLPKVWNKKYEEYLGIKPKNDAEGVLQDVHWAGGDFGYFPSYAIGNAIAAQIYYHIKDKISFEKYLVNGNLKPIVQYLNENIHKFGVTKTTNQILVDLMGEPFNPDYYIKYLKERFTKVYEL